MTARPAITPALTRSLAALSVLEAVQTAMPTPDPVTGHTLLQAAHELALTVAQADLRGAADVPEAYAAHLANQLARLEAAASLTRMREPSMAVRPTRPPSGRL